MASVKAPATANAELDCKNLHTAMKGFGADEKTIIQILGRRNVAQRREIRRVYKSLYGDDLDKKLKSELKGNFEETVLALIQEPAERDATFLRNAMQGPGTDEKMLINILCTRNNAEIAMVKEAYRLKFGRDLVRDVESETSGNLRRILVAYAQGLRPTTVEVNMQQATLDAEELYRAGEGRWGTDESAFIRLICGRSPAQLAAISHVYARNHHADIEKVIEREMSGDLERAFLAIVKSIRNTPAYFAEVLFKSMRGAGTDDRTLIATVVTRADIDMEYIKIEFLKAYKKSLGAMIASDTSGDYRRMLMVLIGDE